MTSDEIAIELWLDEFIIRQLCGLCGNSGVINTLGVHSSAGVSCGKKFFCICPNGRALKRNGIDIESIPDGYTNR